MNANYLLIVLLILASPVHADEWSLDGVDDSMIVRGDVQTAAGTNGLSLVFNGQSLVELEKSASLSDDAFTFSLWFNPYDLVGGQQVLVGKNRYSRNERQWTLTIEPDGKVKAYLRQRGWSTIACDTPIIAGRWHLATLVVEPTQGSLYLNGKLVGTVDLQTPIAATPAPITLGGIWDKESVRQAFRGALDECSYESRALSGDEIATAYRPVLTKHRLPDFAKRLPLWDETQVLPKAADLPSVRGADFRVLKRQRPDIDGCNWTLGVGLAWHKDKLYASYGFNKGSENTFDILFTLSGRWLGASPQTPGIFLGMAMVFNDG
ncbi:MAG: LamG domain-containing protein [Pirellulaceae bacterium]